MMTGGKVIVTYKRKRPPPMVAYKRRRLPLRDELHQKNESSGPKLSHTSVEQKVEPTAINERECPVKGFEHTLEEKGHLSNSMKEGERNLFAVPVKASKSENKNQNIPNMMQLAAEPLAVLDTSPRLYLSEDGLSAKDETRNLCTSAATKRKLGRSLITYQRRCNCKRDVNELQMQRMVDINRDGSLGSTSSVFAQEAKQSKSGSQHPLIARMNLKSSCPGARSSCESECFKQAADNEMENIRSEDTSSVGMHTQIAEVSPCSLDKGSGLEFQKDSLENSSHNSTFDLALKPINSGLEFQEGPMGNSSNKATVDPALEPVNSSLEFKEDSLEHSLNDPLGNSSNNATFDSALVPFNSDLGFKEDSLLHLSNDNAVDPALEPINSGLEFHEGPLGNSSNNATVKPVNSGLEFKEDSFGHSSNDMTVDPALKPVNSGLEFQEGPLVNSSNNATVDPALEPVNSGLEFREDSLGHSSNDNTVDPAFEPINSGLEFQEGPLGNSSYNATVDPVLEPVNCGLEFKVDSFGHSSNDITVDPALKPVNSGLEFQEGPLKTSSNNATINPALEPINPGLEFQKDLLGKSSKDATIDPALEPVNSGCEFQEGPMGNSSNNATVDPVLEPVNSGIEFQEGRLENSSNNATLDPALEPVNPGPEFKEGPLGNSSNNATVDPAHEFVNSGLEFQEGFLGNSANNSTVGPALESVLFDRHSSTGEESQLLSGDAPNTGGTCEIPCSRVVKESLDLSVPPPGGCDSTSVHDENPLGISVNAPFGEHDAQLNDECPGVKGLDLLHKNTVEIRPSQQSEAAVGCSHHELTNSSSAGMPRSACLQLFPEDRMDDLSQSTKIHQRDTAGSSSREKTVNPSETCGDRTAEAKSSLLYGLFMPMEAIHDGHSYNTASSQWPIGGIQLRDFLQDGSKKFSGQPSTSQRRSMVLDGMVDRARTQRNRPSPPSLYGYPTVLWTEEELDSLWVGVRRYGRGNWEVMLRDPRLAFSALRTPWDLALQWEQEQSKLLNNIPSVEGRKFRQSTGFLGGMDGMCWQPKIGRQHSEGEPNLSLGDVYSGQSSSVSLQSNVPRHHQQATTSTRDRHSYTGSLRRLTPDADCSVSANSSTSMATGRSRPHWLKELVALAPMPTEGAVQLDTAAVRDPWNRTEIAGPRAHLANEKDLIVIDSGASSEDTISDDRGAKM